MAPSSSGVHPCSRLRAVPTVCRGSKEAVDRRDVNRGRRRVHLQSGATVPHPSYLDIGASPCKGDFTGTQHLVGGPSRSVTPQPINTHFRQPDPPEASFRSSMALHFLIVVFSARRIGGRCRRPSGSQRKSYSWARMQANRCNREAMRAGTVGRNSNGPCPRSRSEFGPRI